MYVSFPIRMSRHLGDAIKDNSLDERVGFIKKIGNYSG